MAGDVRLLVRPTPPVEAPPVVWVDCPMCWAAGRILADGAYRPCGHCLGIGQVTRPEDER